jgi:hypothetical protein
MSDTFKDLNLNREVIDEALKTYCEGATVTQQGFTNDLVKVFIKVPHEEKPSTLNIYYKKDGKTTIACHEGENKELGKKVAQHVIDKTAFDVKFNAPIYIKNLSDESLNMLFDFLVNYCHAEKIGEVNLTNGIKYEYQSKYGDKIHLNHYTTGSFNVQGKSGLLKSQVIEGLSSYLTYGEMVQATLESFSVKDLDKTSAEKLFDARLPYSTKMLHNKVRVIILPAFITERLDIETTDYSFMVFPVLRGAEGFIKQLFIENGINIDNTFAAVLEDDGTGTTNFKLNANAESNINCIFTKRSIEKLYNFYKKIGTQFSM